MSSNQTVTVFGAYGHTGRFVVSELRKRGLKPILSGRDAGKLKAFAAAYADLEIRVASVDEAGSLDEAISGAAAVINCAGPFIDTAVPVIEAALRAGIHYLDVAGEQGAVLNIFERFADAALDKNIVIAPTMAFFGGLGDLLATAAMGNWTTADEICVAIALDSWNPTPGTRLTGQRRKPGSRRLFFSDNKLEPAQPPPNRLWNFSAPFGTQEVVGISYPETITIPFHLQMSELSTYINLAPIRDIRNPETPPPTAADESGRSSQIFLVEAAARKGDQMRRATAGGRDIYAVTAPIVVEATKRVISGLGKKTGVAAAGELFDARDFLISLSPEHVSLTI